MNLIIASNLIMGSFNGISKFNQKPIDKTLIYSYFSIITSITVARIYNINTSYTHGYIKLPLLLTLSFIANGSTFCLGHHLGKGYSHAILV